MKWLQRTAGARLFDGLSGFGAVELFLSLGMHSEVATLVGAAAFIGTFFDDRAHPIREVILVTTSVKELEREFAREVGRFIDLAVETGHSVEEAKAMIRDVVAKAVRRSFKVVRDSQ
jgi:hypothetical protein